MIPIIFAGTSSFAVQCLKYLLESQFFQVQAIITISDRQGGRGMRWQSSAVKIYSKSLKIPVLIPTQLDQSTFLKEISQFKSQLCVVCSYGKILPPVFLDLFPLSSVNIHPSLLPLWRGAAPIERALMNGDFKTGVSLQIVAHQLDAGDIIGQVSFPIKPTETSIDIYKKAEMASQKLLQKDLVSYVKGESQPTKQDETKVTYAPKIKKKEALICWNQPAQDLHNKVRALVLGPQPYTFFKGERLKIYKSEVWPEDLIHQNQFLKQKWSDYSEGEIILADNKQLIVACRSSGLGLLEIQRSGHKKQSIQDFLRGMTIKAGDIFKKPDDV